MKKQTFRAPPAWYANQQDRILGKRGQKEENAKAIRKDRRKDWMEFYDQSEEEQHDAE